MRTSGSPEARGTKTTWEAGRKRVGPLEDHLEGLEVRGLGLEVGQYLGEVRLVGHLGRRHERDVRDDRVRVGIAEALPVGAELAEERLRDRQRDADGDGPLLRVLPQDVGGGDWRDPHRPITGSRRLRADTVTKPRLRYTSARVWTSSSKLW